MIWRSSAVLMLTLALLGGCQPSGDPETLETEEVTERLDVDLSFEEDRQAVRRAAELSGVLPSDFPSDFPVYKPSTVVDFGDLEGGRYFVVLFTPDRRATVEQFVNSAAPGAGWSLQSASPDTGEFAFRSGARSVTTVTSEESGGTEVRIEY